MIAVPESCHIPEYLITRPHTERRDRRTATTRFLLRVSRVLLFTHRPRLRLSLPGHPQVPINKIQPKRPKGHHQPRLPGKLPSRLRYPASVCIESASDVHTANCKRRSEAHNKPHRPLTRLSQEKQNKHTLPHLTYILLDLPSPPCPLLSPRRGPQSLTKHLPDNGHALLSCCIYSSFSHLLPTAERGFSRPFTSDPRKLQRTPARLLLFSHANGGSIERRQRTPDPPLIDTIDRAVAPGVAEGSKYLIWY